MVTNGGWAKLQDLATIRTSRRKSHSYAMVALNQGGDQMAIDPVCSMEVDEKTAPAKSEYMGKTYYFCALGCKKTFDENPTQYVESEVQGMGGHGGSGARPPGHP